MKTTRNSASCLFHDIKIVLQVSRSKGDIILGQTCHCTPLQVKIKIHIQGLYGYA